MENVIVDCIVLFKGVRGFLEKNTFHFDEALNVYIESSLGMYVSV